MNPPAMPTPDRRRDVRNWIVFMLLLAAAALMYAAIVMKIGRFGYGET